MAMPGRNLRELAVQRLKLLPESGTAQRERNVQESSPGSEAADARAILSQLGQRPFNRSSISVAELRDILERTAGLLGRAKRDQCALVHHLVSAPFKLFTPESVKVGISLWLNVIRENPRLETQLIAAVVENWIATVRRKQGLFNEKLRHLDPFYIKEEFAPSDRDAILKRRQVAIAHLSPHAQLIQFLAARYEAADHICLNLEKLYLRLLLVTLRGLRHASGHPLAREVRFHIVLLSLKHLKYNAGLSRALHGRLQEQTLSAALSWFSYPPSWSFGDDASQAKVEIQLVSDTETALQNLPMSDSYPSTAHKSPQGQRDLLQFLLDDERNRLLVWLYPLGQGRHHLFHSHVSKRGNNIPLSSLVRTAWAECPSLAVHLLTRLYSPKLANELRLLLLNFPEKAMAEPDALQILLGSSLPDDVSFQLKYLLFWAPVNPITAVTYFLPGYGNHPFILQYAMRALSSHSIDVTFFYVPQIVQALRYDALGYVERYILETGRHSQLFAHQIIWNIKANAYKDENSRVPDPVKPTLDRVLGSLISSFSGADRAFYEREFSFFNEVTDISGKLRPFIKKSKGEKKQKIEEELHKIKVEVGVYLPSNPDGIVVDIDRKSGKPLQSHAKAPFMATFKIRKTIGDMEATEELLDDIAEDGQAPAEKTQEVMQSAIFKVGDDCRQDVLALQMIAAFRGIFNHAGLDVFVYPYRVIATAPGCGVIDVIPRSISRDILGREAENDLYKHFLAKYGAEDSERYKQAQANFVKSMAAYSVISYLLQLKDRHNGNIMIDDDGHLMHIDFGFCFDIAPGGVKFERAPFKLTSEMVNVMGGSTESPVYQWFESLCIKAFLASRQYSEKLAHIVLCMLDSGLPCFKPETVQHFRERFVLDKTQREAAEFMRFLIRKSQRSHSTKGYDHFQLMTNGIPY